MLEAAQIVSTLKLIPISAYGVIAFTYIGWKIANSYRYSPTANQGHTPTASVIIPVYNENPELFWRCLKSVLRQDYPLEEIWIVDDGSDKPDAYQIAQHLGEQNELIKPHQFNVNQGKRHAQSHAFKQASGDVFVTIDSDTILDDNAIKNIVQPLANADTKAVTGYPKIVNKNANLLTRLIDMRYYVAFNVERASQSVFGIMTCCCGVLSAYDADVVRDVVDDYESQSFLGEECTFGDDRRLTAHCLKRGTVVYQSTATARTDAPEQFSKFIKQQTRWMRSFWRESLLALKWTPKRSKLLTATIVLDMLLPFLLITFGAGGYLWRNQMSFQHALVIYPLVITGIAYIRHIQFIRKDPLVYTLAPLYACLYVFLLLPLNFWALATVNSSHWGTR